ncbi:hypothetical protein Tco_0714956, partial [Tanacetum coccineum]
MKKKNKGTVPTEMELVLEQTQQDKMAEENVLAPTRTDEYFQLDELWFTLDADLLPNYAELIWEEFVQAIKTFFSDAGNLKVPTKKPKPHVILYCRFTKLIICYLGGRHNIHKRAQSPLHITADDYSLGNLKFVPKGGLDEVFGMTIPKDLITDVIRNLEYYQKYLGMAARKPRQATTVTDEEGGKKKAQPAVIMKYLVKISKKARILEPKRRHLKITILTSNTPYPSRKIRHICACTSLKTTKEQDPIRRIQKKTNTPYSSYGNKIFWKISNVTKPVKEKTSKPSPSKKIRKGKVMKVHKGKRSDHLVDEEDEEGQPAPEPQVEDDEYNLQRGIQMSLESSQAPVGGVAIRKPVSGITRQLLVIEGKGKGIISDEQAAQLLLDLQKLKKKSTTDQYIFQRRTPTTQDASTGPSAQPQDDTSENVVRDTSSPADAETSADTEKSNNETDTEILNVDEERGEDVSNMVELEERTVELDEGQARSDPGKTPESRPPPEREFIEEDQAGPNPGQSHVAQAGSNPEPMHEDFIATVYPKVHESLKHTTEEQVLIENPPSSTETLSSMKNLEDTFTFGDQFLNDKPTEDEP